MRNLNVRTLLKNNCKNYNYQDCQNHLDECIQRRGTFPSAKIRRPPSCAARSGYRTRPLSEEEYSQLLSGKLTSIDNRLLISSIRDSNGRLKQIPYNSEYNNLNDDTSENGNRKILDLLSFENLDLEWKNMNQDLSNSNSDSDPDSDSKRGDYISTSGGDGGSIPILPKEQTQKQNGSKRLNLSNLSNLPKVSIQDIASYLPISNKLATLRTTKGLQSIVSSTPDIKCLQDSFKNINCSNPDWLATTHCNKYCESLNRGQIEAYFWSLIDLAIHNQNKFRTTIQQHLDPVVQESLVRLYSQYIRELKNKNPLNIRQGKYYKDDISDKNFTAFMTHGPSIVHQILELKENSHVAFENPLHNILYDPIKGMDSGSWKLKQFPTDFFLGAFPEFAKRFNKNDMEDKRLMDLSNPIYDRCEWKFGRDWKIDPNYGSLGYLLPIENPDDLRVGYFIDQKGNQIFTQKGGGELNIPSWPDLSYSNVAWFTPDNEFIIRQLQKFINQKYPSANEQEKFNNFMIMLNDLIG